MRAFSTHKAHNLICCFLLLLLLCCCCVCVTHACTSVAGVFTVLFPSGDVEQRTRLQVCFNAEVPQKFVNRLVFAHAAREMAESLIRYNLYIDCMPTDGVAQLDSEQINRIVSKALNTLMLKRNEFDTNQLLAEINTDYARTMNKIVFDANMRDPNNNNNSALALPVSVTHPTPAPPSTCAFVVWLCGFGIVFFCCFLFLSLTISTFLIGHPFHPFHLLHLCHLFSPPSPLFTSFTSFTARELAVVETPPHDFAEKFSTFAFNTCLAQDAVVLTLQRVQHECLQMLNLRGLVTTSKRPMKVRGTTHT
jgi:hypothetical protein